MSTVPGQFTAMVAALADQLADLAATAIRGQRPDLALTLLTEARAVLVSDIVMRLNEYPRSVARVVATGHVHRVLRGKLTDHDRAALDTIRWADQRDVRPDDDDEATPDLLVAPTEDDRRAVADVIAGIHPAGQRRAAHLTDAILAALAARGRLVGDDGARDENGDWWTCSLHGGAITQDCACDPRFGLGDLTAAAQALFDANTRGHYGTFDTLEPQVQARYAADAAAVVEAYHQAAAVVPALAVNAG